MIIRSVKVLLISTFIIVFSIIMGYKIAQKGKVFNNNFYEDMSFGEGIKYFIMGLLPSIISIFALGLVSYGTYLFFKWIFKYIRTGKF